MEAIQKDAINEDAVNLAIVEIKLYINHRLYSKGALTEEMYTKAKDIILKDAGRSTYVAS